MASLSGARATVQHSSCRADPARSNVPLANIECCTVAVLEGLTTPASTQATEIGSGLTLRAPNPAREPPFGCVAHDFRDVAVVVGEALALQRRVFDGWRALA